MLISSEAENTDPFFEKYMIRISPDLIHHVMAKAQLLVTEGATMASECAMMGTPAIYVNSLDAGTLREQEDKYQLIYGFRSSAGVLEKVSELINTTGSEKVHISSVVKKCFPKKLTRPPFWSGLLKITQAVLRS